MYGIVQSAVLGLAVTKDTFKKSEWSHLQVFYLCPRRRAGYVLPTNQIA